MAALDKLNISTAFLDLDPENWPSSEDYLKGLEVVQNIKVTNDHAERGVALVQEFNRHITHDEDQLQFLLQVVSEHRRQFPIQQKVNIGNIMIVFKVVVVVVNQYLFRVTLFSYKNWSPMRPW